MTVQLASILACLQIRHYILLQAAADAASETEHFRQSCYWLDLSLAGTPALTCHLLLQAAPVTADKADKHVGVTICSCVFLSPFEHILRYNQSIYI